MPFAKGQSGNLNGRPKRGNAFSDQLRIVLADDADHALGAVKKGKPALRVVVEQLVSAALKGELPAIKEVADRLDGKPAQAIEHTGDDGGPILTANLTDKERAKALLDVLRASESK